MNGNAVVASRGTTIDAALLVLRIASALAFLYHGLTILFGTFGGQGRRDSRRLHICR
jgi:uncharacterized membrane protein YphA (DoxX/SURF4 family)